MPLMRRLCVRARARAVTAAAAAADRACGHTARSGGGSLQASQCLPCLIFGSKALYIKHHFEHVELSYQGLPSTFSTASSLSWLARGPHATHTHLPRDIPPKGPWTSAVFITIGA